MAGNDSRDAVRRRKLKAVIGRAERVDFPDSRVTGVPAKVDTGAFRSSVWASNIKEADGVLHYTLLGPESTYYSGKECKTTIYELIDVENSFGHTEKRYSVYMRIRMGSKVVRTNFTLAARGKKTYPVLVGRKLLRGRYIVDVSEGQPIDDEETKKA